MPRRIEYTIEPDERGFQRISLVLILSEGQKLTSEERKKKEQPKTGMCGCLHVARRET